MRGRRERNSAEFARARAREIGPATRLLGRGQGVDSAGAGGSARSVSPLPVLCPRSREQVLPERPKCVGEPQQGAAVSVYFKAFSPSLKPGPLTSLNFSSADYGEFASGEGGHPHSIMRLGAERHIGMNFKANDPQSPSDFYFYFFPLLEYDRRKKK